MKKTIITALAAATILAGCSKSKTDAPANKTYGAYMIVKGENYKAEDLGPYAASLPPIYAKYGGEYIVFTTKYDTLEGAENAQAIIISGWPSVEAANEFWVSPEYREAIKLRENIGEFTVVVLPALAGK